MKKANSSLIAGAILAGSMLASSSAFAIDRGELLANTCAGCHGPSGVSHGPATPTIAGMSAAYFTESMVAYRDATRPSTIMTRIAKGYSDDDIAAMATYFSKQKYISAEQTTDKAMAKAGEKLHDKYCEKCHSAAGTVADDDSGMLGGQWKPYLHYNLTDFTSGNREMPKKMAKQLNALVEKEGQEGIDKLVEFYSSK